MNPNHSVSLHSAFPEEDPRKKIIFYDLETTIPLRKGDPVEILEFAAVVVAVQGFYETHSFCTLVRPSSLSLISRKSVGCNGISAEAVRDAPCFGEIADRIYHLLHGHIWAGHNIMRFDNVRLKDAFARIGREAPEPAGVVDTLPLLRDRFGRRAGSLKMAALGEYCGLGVQAHRSLEDVRMNVEVLKQCATMLLLESSFPEIFPPSLQQLSQTAHSSSRQMQTAVESVSAVTDDGVTAVARRQSSEAGAFQAQSPRTSARERGTAVTSRGLAGERCVEVVAESQPRRESREQAGPAQAVSGPAVTGQAVSDQSQPGSRGKTGQGLVDTRHADSTAMASSYSVGEWVDVGRLRAASSPVPAGPAPLTGSSSPPGSMERIPSSLPASSASGSPVSESAAAGATAVTLGLDGGEPFFGSAPSDDVPDRPNGQSSTRQVGSSPAARPSLVAGTVQVGRGSERQTLPGESVQNTGLGRAEGTNLGGGPAATMAQESQSGLLSWLVPTGFGLWAGETEGGSSAEDSGHLYSRRLESSEASRQEDQEGEEEEYFDDDAEDEDMRQDGDQEGGSIWDKFFESNQELMGRFRDSWQPKPWSSASGAASERRRGWDQAAPGEPAPDVTYSAIEAALATMAAVKEGESRGVNGQRGEAGRVGSGPAQRGEAPESEAGAPARDVLLPIQSPVTQRRALDAEAEAKQTERGFAERLYLESQTAAEEVLNPATGQATEREVIETQATQGGVINPEETPATEVKVLCLEAQPSRRERRSPGTEAGQGGGSEGQEPGASLSTQGLRTLSPGATGSPQENDARDLEAQDLTAQGGANSDIRDGRDGRDGRGSGGSRGSIGRGGSRDSRGGRGGSTGGAIEGSRQGKEGSLGGREGSRGSAGTFPEGLEAREVRLELLRAVARPDAWGPHGLSILYDGRLLVLRDSWTRVRCSVSDRYAFDDAGRPKFTLLVEPSQATCRLLQTCDELLHDQARAMGDSRACRASVLEDRAQLPAVRLKIATAGVRGSAVYRTQFLRRSGPSWRRAFEEFQPEAVEPPAFRAALPDGSFVEATFAVETYKFEDHRGLRLVALVLVVE